MILLAYTVHMMASRHSGMAMSFGSKCQRLQEGLKKILI